MQQELRKEYILLWNLSSRELLVFIGFYAVMGFNYWLALYLTSNGDFNSWLQTSVNYTFKFCWTIPVYWIVFWKCRQWPLRNRLWLHIVLMPLYIFCWVKTFYFFLDTNLKEIGHLRGPSSYWDVYIGALLYLVQFAALHIYENYTRLREQKEKEQALERLAHLGEMNALKAQIQPHFLFNTLNSISASVPSGMEHTRELIAKLADTFRFALHNASAETVPLYKELDFIKAYLDLEKERFSDRQEIAYEIDESLLQSAIPPMLLQPLIENALHHGIAKSIAGGKITISVQPQQESVLITIADSGAGLNGTKPEDALTKGIGLSNTNMRVKKLYGKDISIAVPPTGGLALSFLLPKLIRHD